MKKIGIDVGSMYTKTINNVMRSTVREKRGDDIKENMLGIEGELVKVERGRYVVGGKGNVIDSLIKNRFGYYIILISVMLYKESMQDVNKFKILVGLPIGIYAKNKDDMQMMLMKGMKNLRCEMAGVEKVVSVEDVEVFPEGAGVYFAKNEIVANKKSLIIDFGGLSVDVLNFSERGRLKKYSSYRYGTMTIFTKIAQMINSLYGTYLDEWDVDSDMRNKGKISVGGEEVREVEDIIDNEVQELINKIRLDFDLRSMDVILLSGGGSQIKKVGSVFRMNHKNVYVDSESTVSNVKCKSKK